jgi:hypothetical protein
MLKRTHINYDWKYMPDFKGEYIAKTFQDSFFETINLPHTNILIPYNTLMRGYTNLKAVIGRRYGLIRLVEMSGFTLNLKE